MIEFISDRHVHHCMWEISITLNINVAFRLLVRERDTLEPMLLVRCRQLRSSDFCCLLNTVQTSFHLKLHIPSHLNSSVYLFQLLKHPLGCSITFILYGNSIVSQVLSASQALFETFPSSCPRSFLKDFLLPYYYYAYICLSCCFTTRAWDPRYLQAILDGPLYFEARQC